MDSAAAARYPLPQSPHLATPGAIPLPLRRPRKINPIHASAASLNLLPFQHLLHMLIHAEGRIHIHAPVQRQIFLPQRFPRHREPAHLRGCLKVFWKVTPIRPEHHHRVVGHSDVDSVRRENLIVKVPVVESDAVSIFSSLECRSHHFPVFVTIRDSNSASASLSKLYELDISICKTGAFIFIRPSRERSLDVKRER